MSLQAIQKRVAELSAELATISVELNVLLVGAGVEVVKATHGERVSNFRQLKEGDVLLVGHPFQDINGDDFPAGEYKVSMVERESYAGVWNVLIDAEDEFGRATTWINFNTLTRPEKQV